MRYGSVCSGIEAATVAWHPMGWEPVFFSEIEPFPSAVLKHHYPDVPNLGDMTKFKDWPDVSIDLLVGGTPCQSFSVAGLRAGLADPRGNLLLTYLAIAARYRPRWLVWENVPGVLSSTTHDAPDPRAPGDPVDLGRDGQTVDVADEYDAIETQAFGTLLAGFTELGYGFAYRILDAQFCRASGLPYAVPQRRRRVFVVGCLGGWAGPAAVFLDAQSLRGDSPPRREAGQGIATTIDASAGRRRGSGMNPNQLVGVDAYVPDIVPQAMSSKWSKGSSGPAGDEVANLVAHSLRAEGFDASEDGTGRGTPLVSVPFSITPSNSNKDYNARVADKAQASANDDGSTSRTLQATNPVAVAIAFGSKDHGGDASEGVSPTLRAGGFDGSHANAGVPPAVAIPVAPTLRAGGNATGGDRPYGTDVDTADSLVAIPFDTTQITHPENRSNPQPDDPAGTLPKAGHPPAIAFQPRYVRNGRGAPDEEVTAPLTAQAGETGKGDSATVVATGWAVRRLTPLECCRLQGFPDDYLSQVRYRGGAPADGPMYKALGNSMAVNVMRVIGERIDMVDGVLDLLEDA